MKDQNTSQSLFKSQKGKEEILNLYQEKLNEVNVDHEFLSINTSFGTTNVIAAGKEENPPIILVHGSNGCAPLAFETYPNLHKEFRVYAVDVLAQPNKSAETRPSMKDHSYGQWMNEIITALELNEVRMAGFSFGGLVILKTLEYDESKVKKVYLSAPAYIVNGNPLIALFKIFIPMKRYMRTGKQKFVESFLKEVFTTRDEFAIKYLSMVFEHFVMDFTPVPVISDNNAKRITTPIALFAAKQDIMFPGEKMLKRAKKIFPSLKESILLESSKHVQDHSDNLRIENTILNDL